MFVLWALPLGIAIGAISGLFGVGGGFLLTPILLLIGYSPPTAITISLLYSMSTSLSGTVKYLQKKRILWRHTLLLATSGMISTQLAKPLVVTMENKGIDELVIPILYILLLGSFSISMLIKEQSIELTNPTISTSPLRSILIGLTGGFVSSILGVGGGFVMVPLLIRVLRIPPRLAVGTSLATIFLIVSAGFFTYIDTVTIPVPLAIVLVVGALIGSLFGAGMIDFFSERTLKKLLGILYIFTLASIVLELVHQSKIGIVLLGGYVAALMLLFIYQYRTKKKRLFFFE